MLHKEQRFETHTYHTPIPHSPHPISTPCSHTTHPYHIPRPHLYIMYPDNTPTPHSQPPSLYHVPRQHAHTTIRHHIHHNTIIKYKKMQVGVGLQPAFFMPKLPHHYTATLTATLTAIVDRPYQPLHLQLRKIDCYLCYLQVYCKYYQSF